MMTFMQTLHRRTLAGASVLAVVAMLSGPALAQTGQYPDGVNPQMGQQMPRGQMGQPMPNQI